MQQASTATAEGRSSFHPIPPFHTPHPPTTQVCFFSIGQVVHAEGCYSRGRVTVTALPEELYGADNRRTWPLRRVQGLATEQEIKEHVGAEMGKVRVTGLGTFALSCLLLSNTPPSSSFAACRLVCLIHLPLQHLMVVTCVHPPASCSCQLPCNWSHGCGSAPEPFCTWRQAAPSTRVPSRWPPAAAHA